MKRMVVAARRGFAAALAAGALFTVAPARLTAQESPPLTLAEAVRGALASHPSLEAAEVAAARAWSRVREAEAARSEARSLWLPKVQLAGRYVECGSEAGRQQGEWPGGLQLSYPLFTGGAKLAAGDRAAAELSGTRAELAQAELRLAEAVDRALAAVESAGARVAALEAAVAQSAEVARIERLALEAGAGVQTDYLGAEAELLRARAARTEARYAEIVARVELARLTGELSTPWLERNLESGS